ncbi:class I SAM-dependent methyltransferase [Ideonella sp. DXS29W]|uniref:Class I SAM-dependent methyltransferase n=1 Tax=Ideonella lacteola TaxID=2984193 RepID=A0ABU9BN05_9BURK
MIASFYDELAPFYHLLYGDWEAALAHQGRALAGLLARHGVGPGAQVLDAACGIGTQTLGLLTYGYRVTASDISPGAAGRLREELVHRRLQAEVRVDDLRTLALAGDASVDALIACDNSVPHLLTEDELLQAFRSAHRCLKPGGLVVLSVRDYAATPRQNPDVRPYGLRYENGQRFLATQVWEWDGDHHYDLRIYLTRESADGHCDTRVLSGRYHAVTIDQLMTLLHVAGFTQMERHDDVLFQPVLLARKR